MKSVTPTLVLLTLLALLVPGALSAAATPAPARATAAAPVSVDQFLASLAAPAPQEAAADGAIFATITCTTSADCPTGQKCCYPCGIPDCNFICMKVKRCPLIP